MSDKKILLETICKVQEGLNLEDKAYYIADSAFYTAPNLVKSLLVADVPYIRIN